MFPEFSPQKKQSLSEKIGLFFAKTMTIYDPYEKCTIKYKKYNGAIYIFDVRFEKEEK